MEEIKSKEIDLSTQIFKESHKIDDIYNNDEHQNIRPITTSTANDNIKKLIRSLEKSTPKK